MKVKPTCRYEHGPLSQIETTEESAWGLVGVAVKRVAGIPRAGDPAHAALFPNEKIYTVKVFRCSTCGYIEMFDEDDSGE